VRVVGSLVVVLCIVVIAASSLGPGGRTIDATARRRSLPAQ
jgi:hypothetical protein